MKSKIVLFLIIIFISLNSRAQQIDFIDDYSKKTNQAQFFNLSLYDKDTENLWKNIFIDKDYDQISLFLDNLPVNSKDKVFQEIIFQILTSNKIFPKNRISDEQFSFIFNKIIDKLFITGRFNEIEFLYSKYPKLSNTSFVLQRMIEGNLLRNRHTEACKILEKNFDENLLKLGKIMIMCNIINSKFDEAKLGLQLLKEQNNPGDLFFIELAFSLMSEENKLDSKGLKKTLDNLKELNPIIISSLQFADISPNFEQIEKFSISGLLSILSNPSVERELKIYCSEILVKIGRIDAETLSNAYQLSRFKPSELERANKIYKTLSPNRARPLLFQAILRDKKPETRFNKIISLIKVSQSDNLIKEISKLIDITDDLKIHVKSSEDATILSKLFQSRGLYFDAKDVLSKNYKKPESDYRKMAIELSEAMQKSDTSFYRVENDLDLVKSIENQESLYLKKIIMIISLYLNLNQEEIEKLQEISISKELKLSGDDFKNLLLALKLSTNKDYFNSISLMFRIVGEEDFENLNIIKTYTLLSILKNLGLENEFRSLSERVLL